MREVWQRVSGRAYMKQGKPIAASLEHLVFCPAKPSNNCATLVALHGRGTDANDLVPLVLALGLDDILLFAPRAPLPFSLGVGFAWYGLNEVGVPQPQTFRASLDLLRNFILEIKKGYPVDPERLILLGFSQGTVMAYAAALLDPDSFRGIAALSGYVPIKSGLPLQLEKLNGLSAFISHGMYDEIIPVQFGRESAEFLKKAGAHVVYREYAMGHEVSEETLRDLAVWTKNLLSR